MCVGLQDGKAGLYMSSFLGLVRGRCCAVVEGVPFASGGTCLRHTHPLIGVHGLSCPGIHLDAAPEPLERTETHGIHTSDVNQCGL